MTGASGLIGSHVAALLRQRGDEVIALQRATADVSFLTALGCEVRAGNVLDPPEIIAKAADACEAVVHSAALVYTRASWPQVRAVNVEGTENVLRGAALAGIGRAVHISSVAVYGPVSAVTDEDSPVDSPLRPSALYARSKRAAEAVAAAVHAEGRIQVTTLRPAAVYGERDRLFLPILARALQLPVFPILGGGENTLPVVYAGNVAAGVVAALSGRGAGRAYNLALDYPLTQRELLEGLARGLGVRPRFVAVPAGLVESVARVVGALGAAIPGVPELPLRRIARIGLRENPYRSDRARADLGWDPPYGHSEALARTAAWLSNRAA